MNFAPTDAPSLVPSDALYWSVPHWVGRPTDDAITFGTTTRGCSIFFTGARHPSPDPRPPADPDKAPDDLNSTMGDNESFVYRDLRSSLVFEYLLRTHLLQSLSTSRLDSAVDPFDPFEMFDASTSHVPLVSDAVQQRNIVMSLRAAHREDAADRIAELVGLIYEDPDEPRIVVESLRHFAAFLIAHPQLETPVVGVDPRGQVQAEWAVLERGLVVMSFRPDGLVRIVAISGPATLGEDRLKVSDTLPRGDVLGVLEPFFSGS